jgi:hypothetical protein
MAIIKVEECNQQKWLNTISENYYLILVEGFEISFMLRKTLPVYKNDGIFAMSINMQLCSQNGCVDAF